MKQKPIILYILMILLTASFLIMPLGAAENYRRIYLKASLIVFNPEETQGLIVTWLDENNGYFLVKSDELLTARIPFDRIREFSELLEKLGIDVKSIDEQSEDVQAELVTITAGIKSREEILARNLRLFEGAGVDDTLGIEKELILLMEEIENLKGRLNKLEVDRKFAFAEIYFAFKKSALPENIPSSFEWINSLDLYRFKQEGFPNEK